MSYTLDALAYKAYNLRVDVIRATTAAGSGHPTSCLSAVDIMTALFFHALQFDGAHPDCHTNDRFVLSKGHAAPLLYAVYKELGFITDAQLMAMRTIDSPLEGHPTPRFAHVDIATGSLGIGLSNAVGMALHAQRNRLPYYTYVLLGDGELAEGAVWESAALASYYKLDHIIAIVDVNRFGQRGPTMYEHDLVVLANKFEAFGWRVSVVDGHDINQLMVVLDGVRKACSGSPVVILAKTIKGYGVEHVQDKNGFHGKAFSVHELAAVLVELKKRFYNPAWDAYSGQQVPLKQIYKKSLKQKPITVSEQPYTIGERVSLRQAFGDILARAGREIQDIVCLDADVGNSTYTDIFAREIPARFFECFIAEQSMVGAAMGMSAMGDRVVIATFAAFLSRAYDQLRMAAISRLPLRVVGTHVGVEIGQDGPSQMGLEDLALFRALPNSLVVYPADAHACSKLFNRMLNYHDGISYMRVTRGSLPIIYDAHALFDDTGFNILRSSDHDCATVIAAGVTLHEALKAYELLKKIGIFVRVVDLYCIKPVDRQKLRACVMDAGSCVVSVEDHYSLGGIADVVSAALIGLPLQLKALAGRLIPPSGTAAQLLAWAGIDAQSIEHTLMGMLKEDK